jgi:hypothetical protein
MASAEGYAWFRKLGRLKEVTSDRSGSSLPRVVILSFMCADKRFGGGEDRKGPSSKDGVTSEEITTWQIH